MHVLTSYLPFLLKCPTVITMWQMYDVRHGGEAVRIGEEFDQVDVDDDL